MYIADMYIQISTSDNSASSAFKYTNVPNVRTNVIIDIKIFDKLWSIAVLNSSTSFVKMEIVSPDGFLSKNSIPIFCILENNSFLILYTMFWAILAIISVPK